eukprot:5145595-Prymnesium_polylepis.1
MASRWLKTEYAGHGLISGGVHSSVPCKGLTCKGLTCFYYVALSAPSADRALSLRTALVNVWKRSGACRASPAMCSRLGRARTMHSCGCACGVYVRHRRQGGEQPSTSLGGNARRNRS